MKIKRRKKPKLLTVKQFERAFKHEIKQAINDAVPDYLTTELREESDLEKQVEVEKEIDQRILAAKSRIVKKAFAILIKCKDYIQDEYKRELEYSGERYPTKWMLDDKQINYLIERRPIILKFANYLFEYTRHVSWKKIEEMLELTHGTTYGDKVHPLAVFIADADFWNDVAAELKCAEITLKKLLKEFCEAGIVIELGSVATHKRGRQPGLYSDGYYIDWEGKFVKQPFLTQKIKGNLLRLSKKI